MKYKILNLNKKKITNFAKERNDLVNKNNSEWLFFLDSDEKISPKLKKELENLDPKDCGAYYVKRKNFFLGQFVGVDRIIRLVKKGSGKWERVVHEVFQPSHPAGVIGNELIHNTADNLRSYIDKINKYSTLHGLANKKENKKATLFKIIFFPIFKFIETLIKSRNVVFSIMQSLHSFLSWSKQYLNQKK